MLMDQEFVDDLDALMRRHGVSARALRFWFVQGMAAAGERPPAYNPSVYNPAAHHSPTRPQPTLPKPTRPHPALSRPAPALPPMGAAPLVRADDPAAGAIAALLETYEPVQLERQRLDGWTPYAQRQFLVALAQGGAVDAAASAAGLGERAAYKLRSHPNGRRFAHAWAQAVNIALDTAAARRAAHCG